MGVKTGVFPVLGAFTFSGSFGAGSFGFFSAVCFAASSACSRGVVGVLAAGLGGFALATVV